jgi:hypothetical protein
MHALFYSNGQWTDLGAPSGATSLRVDGLDDAGQVLIDASIGRGVIGSVSVTDHLFLYDNGQWTDLGAPGNTNSYWYSSAYEESTPVYNCWTPALSVFCQPAEGAYS